MRRIRFLIWKEFLELRQDRRMIPIVFLAPILQLLVLGYAATTDVTHVPMLIVDADRSTASRQLIARFDASPSFTVTDVVADTNVVTDRFEHNTAWLALIIPAGYGADTGTGRPTRVQMLADGTDANSTNIALGYATGVVASQAADLLGARVAAALPPQALRADVRVWFNPQLDSRLFMIPGILALLLIVMTIVLASMGIVRERELGTLEQLHVTPLRRWELIVGKLLPYGVIGAIDVFLVTAVAMYWFEVPLRGSFVLLFSLSMLFLLSTLGLGLFVSTISQTQQQAMMTSVFFFVTPMIYLSGFVFPVENMPRIIQPVSAAIPLTHYLVIVRGIFLKGVGLAVLWPQALTLLLWGVGILTLATLRSAKRSS